MSKSLLFIPDISGFTKFVKTTKLEDSRTVIKELLEGLIRANILDMRVAEVEGDAIFFYLENRIPPSEELLQQVEAMYSAFCGELKILNKPAASLQLKIIAHVADLDFIEVGDSRKPFGSEVIETHQLLKNSIESNNYILVTCALAKEMNLSKTFQNESFAFKSGRENYGENDIDYLYSEVKI